ncbi:MAG: SH3 domain-containing protein [Acidobacteriota bacterium]
MIEPSRFQLVIGPGRRFVASLLLACTLATGLASAATLAELPEGDIPPMALVAKQDGVPIRSEPGHVYRAIDHLTAKQQVIVDRRQGRWLRVKPEGWVFLEHVEMNVARTAPPPPPSRPELRVRVSSNNSRLRSGPTTSSDIVGKLNAGDIRPVLGRDGDWWILADGTFLHSSLAEPIASGPAAGSGATAPRPAPMPAPPRTGGPLKPIQRWSYMDLQGAMFEVTEIQPESGFIPALRQAMRATGVLEDDWTFMRIVIAVPDGPYRFNYSPQQNSLLVLDRQEQKYGSVHVEGPLKLLPANLRVLFEKRTVHPGERFEGIVMFRPTLETKKIDAISMYLGGRLRRLWPDNAS